MVKLKMKPLKDLFMHELLSTGSSPEPPTPPAPAGNVITGTFKATADGNLLVPLSLPQNSYPISVQIFPEDGYNTESDMGSANNNTVITFSMFKQFPNLAPTYAGTINNNDNAAYILTTKTRTGTLPFYPENYSAANKGIYSHDQRPNLTFPQQIDGDNLLIRAATSPTSGAYRYATNVTYRYVVTYK